MKMKNRKLLYYPTIHLLVFACCLLLGSTACEEFTDVELPPDKVGTENVFKNEGSTESALRGIYATAAYSSLVCNLSSYVAYGSDELTRSSLSSSYLPFADNNIDPNNSTIASMWRAGYNLVYQCNNFITNASASTDLPESFKTQLVGEAKFLRALVYFYLVNLWGDVPLTLEANYENARLLSRSPLAEVYAQIEEDLLDAQSKLSSTLYTGEDDRNRVNKWAATALLARVKLYQGDWLAAETQATAVINSEYYILEFLDRVFFEDSQECILHFTNPGTNKYTPLYLSPSSVSSPSVLVTDYVINALVVDSVDVQDPNDPDNVIRIPQDKRRNAWVTPTENGLYKYKTYSNSMGPENVEANIVLRLAEMYLIRAEARAQQENITGENSAETDLNTVRSRAGLTGRSTADKAAMLQFIYDERMIELFGEWSHRWLDVKRTGQADVIFGAHKDNWVSEAALFPIPFSDREKNPNLTQNPGY